MKQDQFTILMRVARIGNYHPDDAVDRGICNMVECIVRMVESRCKVKPWTHPAIRALDDVFFPPTNEDKVE